MSWMLLILLTIPAALLALAAIRRLAGRPRGFGRLPRDFDFGLYKRTEPK